MEKQPLYVRCTAPCPDGECLDLHFKGQLSGDGVYWEVRHPLHALLAGTSFRLSKFIRVQMESWFDACGGFGGPHIKTSAKAGKVMGLDLDSSAANAEFMVSTFALLLFFTWWAVYRKVAKDREVAHAMLSAFLSRVLLPSVAWQALLAIPPEACSLCKLPPQQNGRCPHLQVLQEAMDKAISAGLPFQATLATILGKVYGLGMACHTCKALCQLWCERIAAAIGSSLAGAGLTHDPLQGAVPLQGRKRKLRVDEDLESELLKRSVQGPQPDDKNMYAQLQPGNRSSTVAKWRHRMCHRQLHANWALLSECTSLSVALDATRLGNPGEETLALVAWSSSLEKATWLPIQARRGCKHSGQEQEEAGRAWVGAGCMQARSGQEQGGAGQIIPVIAFPQNAAL